MKKKITKWLRNKIWDFLESEEYPYRAQVSSANSVHHEILQELKYFAERISALCGFLGLIMVQTDISSNGEITHKRITHDIPTDCNYISSLGLSMSFIEMIDKGSCYSRYIKCIPIVDIEKLKKEMKNKSKEKKLENETRFTLYVNAEQQKQIDKLLKKGDKNANKI